MGGARSASRTPWRRGLRVGVGLVLALCVAELALRAWAHHFREPFEVFDGEYGVYRLVPGVHAVRGGRVTINEAGLRGPPLRPRGADDARIVALGDSCTFGGDADGQTWPALLRASDAPLARALGVDDVEVLNGAISGLDSTGGRRRLESVLLPLEPDLVVVYLGWNDLMKRSPAAQRAATPWERARRRIDDLWLVRGLRKALFSMLRPRLTSPETGPASDTGRFADFVPAVFEANLTAIVEASRDAGAGVLLVTLPTGLRRDTTAARIAERQIGFPFFAAADRVGDFLTLIDRYNRAIRQVGARSGAPVVDLARAFARTPEADLLFWDTMHPNRAGQERIAAAIAASIEAEARRPRRGPPAGGGTAR